MQVLSGKHATWARQLSGEPAADPFAAASAAALQLYEPWAGSPPRCGWTLASEPSLSCWPACFDREESNPPASLSNVSPLRKHHFCTLGFPL